MMASSVRLVFGLLAAAAPVGVWGNSMHMAKLCRDEWCQDPEFPLLDYQDGQCVCARHPCWNTDGLKHQCVDSDFPFIHMMYEEDGSVTCRCSSIARYDSIYIAKTLCPGKQCDNEEYPVLDVDDDGVSCVCRSHPCWNVGGQKHACNQKEFPILRYRQDKQGDPVCECVALMEEPEQKSDL
mmetsp:Transcript_51652/g.120922  ORF Transcript_51652/g.120922 Transcript_51652/m.120922 type:complete len:182 (+) Transcript_51652:91-636(+)